MAKKEANYQPYRGPEQEPVLLAELSDIQLQCQLANWQHHQEHSPHIIDDTKKQLMVELEAELSTRDIPKLGHSGIISSFVQLDQLPDGNERKSKYLPINKLAGRSTRGH